MDLGGISFAQLTCPKGEKRVFKSAADTLAAKPLTQILLLLLCGNKTKKS